MGNPGEMKTWVCVYCSTANPIKDKTCLACGATYIETESSNLPTIDIKIKDKDNLRMDMEPEQFAKIIRNANDPVGKGLQVYSVIWRTLGEALAIAVTCFILGVLAAATGLVVIGILVSIVVGFLIGRNNRNFYTVSGGLITAVILGALIGIPCWVIGLGPKGLFFFASGLTIFAALGASYQSPPLSKANIWDKLRPFIGILGGVAFALIGSALAWSILALLEVILQWINRLLGG